MKMTLILLRKKEVGAEGVIFGVSRIAQGKRRVSMRSKDSSKKCVRTEQMGSQCTRRKNKEQKEESRSPLTRRDCTPCLIREDAYNRLAGGILFLMNSQKEDKGKGKDGRRLDIFITLLGRSGR